jgi:hypothetical protein
MLNVRHNVMRSENQAQDNRAAWLGGSTHLPGGGCSSVRSVSSMPFTFRSISSSLSTGRSALLPAQEWMWEVPLHEIAAENCAAIGEHYA